MLHSIHAHWKKVVLLLHACCICACIQSAHAQDAPKDHVEPRLTRAQFTNFIRQFNLDGEQRSVMEMMFADYNAALDDLTVELQQKAEDAGLRDVQETLSGRGRLSLQELQAKRVEILNLYQQAWPTVDQLLDTLLGSVEHLLTDSQATLYPEALRDLHRIIYLHPRQADRDYQEYAGDGVDVLTLADQALAAGGELHALDPSALVAPLMQYELELDALLIQTSIDFRRTRMLRKIATIEKDAAAQRELDQTALQTWKRLYELNHRTVQQIGQIAAASLGEHASRKWLDRFDHASFGWLYPRRKPDRQIEWIRTNVQTPETVQNAENAYSEFLAKRREFARRAIDIMLQARLEFETMLYSMMDPAGIDDRIRRGLYEELLKNSGEQASLESQTAIALENTLDATQRDALRKAMQGPDRRR